MFESCASDEQRSARFRARVYAARAWAEKRNKHSTDVNLLGLDVKSSVAYNLGERQTRNYYYFLTFRSRNPRNRVGDFEVKKRCYVEKCPTRFFFLFLLY